MLPGTKVPLALVMLGDVMLGRLVDEGLSALGAQHATVWGDTLPLLQGGMAAEGQGEAHQIVTGNLECAGRLHPRGWRSAGCSLLMLLRGGLVQ